ncbi:hypothetical protein [Petroclostridium sp. X23]|uniref:hypothetical protein n=1 Tax=Petroclostridium sp. X23 TaxID=3045146 RepID=UPI0024AE011B|nr:hypothetical protein [Petroclostridium sp. X23]WHH59693.1 hypothetical protein QKW49_02725 [Petroclostridium sp. X23]
MEKMLKEILSELREVKAKVTKLEGGQEEIKGDVKDLKQMTKAIFNQTADLTEFRTETNEKLDTVISDIKTMHEDIVAVEYISSKNMNDIAKLKLIK